MDTDPARTVGHTGLSGESDFHPAAPVIVATPAVTHPGAGPSSAMVTRSRARGGRETNVEPEVEFRPEIEFLPEGEIPAQTDEGVSGATRHLTDIASQYRPEVTTSTSISTTTTTTRLPPIILPRNLVSTPHTYIQEAQLMLTNPREAFRGQSRSTKHVTIRYARSYYCATVTLSLRGAVFRYSTSKNVVTVKSGSEVTQGHRNRNGSIRHL